MSLRVDRDLNQNHLCHLLIIFSWEDFVDFSKPQFPYLQDETDLFIFSQGFLHE